MILIHPLAAIQPRVIRRLEAETGRVARIRGRQVVLEAATARQQARDLIKIHSHELRRAGQSNPTPPGAA